MANVVEVLKQDHRKVEILFTQFKSADADRKAELANIICHELTLHSQAEEQVIYPVLPERAGNEGESLQDHSIEEHMVVKEHIYNVQQAGSDLDAAMLELEHAVTHHVQEEESKVLPALEQNSDPDQLNTWALQVEEVKANA